MESPEAPNLAKLSSASPKRDILFRIEEGMSRQAAAKRGANRRRRWRNVLLGVSAAAALLAGAALVVMPGPPASLPSTAPPPGPTSVSPLSAGLRLSGPQVFLTHKVWAAELTQPAYVSRGIRIFDFDSNHFLAASTALSDRSGFLRILEAPEVAEAFLGTWVVIFAAASSDGDADSNLAICRRRVKAVRDELVQHFGDAVRGYWGMPVGRYRAPIAPALRSAEVVSTPAPSSARRALVSERRLLLVAIKTVPDDDTPAQHTLDFIVSLLRERGVLPADYDFATAQPAPL